MFPAYAQKSEPSQSVTTHDASCVDDRRTLPVAQRVLQRESGVVQREGEANGTFKYCESLEKHESGYESGKILFCPYGSDESECKSKNFSGCLMMAFHFNKVNPITGKVNTEESLNALIFGGNSNSLVGEEKNYVAHVFSSSVKLDDTRTALFDAENRGLITIDALFKPCTPLIFQIAKDAMSGGLLRNRGGGWSAKIYAQIPVAYNRLMRAKKKGDLEGTEEISALEGTEETSALEGTEETSVDPDKNPVFEYDVETLKKQTKATKAFVYASVGKYDEMRNELTLGTKNDDGLFDLFLKICSLEVLKQVKGHVPEKKSAIMAEITRRSPEQPSKCCLLL